MAARCLGFLLALLLLAPITAGAQHVKLRITSQLPASHYVGVTLMQFKEAVERRTEKAISIEVGHGGSLYKDLEVLDAVSSGAIEMGFIVTDHLAEKVPATTILSQPFMFNFEALLRAALSPNQDVRRLLDKAILDATGTRVLWWLPLGSSVILSKGQAAVTPAAISKRRMRVPGKATVEFIEHCGGSGSVLNAGEQLSAIKDGKVDMTMTAVTGVIARQLWKVTDTIARTDNSAIESSVIINEAVWQKLSESQRSIIMEVARDLEQKLRERFSKLEADDYRAAREHGMTIHDLTPDQVSEWRACSAPVVDAFMTEAGELAQQLMRAYGKLRTAPCCSAGPTARP